MAWKEDAYYFRRAIALSEEAMAGGNDAFACLLAGPDGTILMEQPNAVADAHDPTAHDAMTLLRRAAGQYDAEYLGKCTLYATMEPCVMCMGAAFWTGLGVVKFAVSERELGTILPGGLDFPSREFASRAPRPIRVEGPCPEVHDEAFAVMRRWVDKILGK